MDLFPLPSLSVLAGSGVVLVSGLSQRVRMSFASLWKRLEPAKGQTTTEYLMIAGILTTIALAFLAMVPDALREFVRSLASGIRTVAP